MIRRPPRSTLFPTRRSSDLKTPIELVSRKNPFPLSFLNIPVVPPLPVPMTRDRKSTRLNSSHSQISYAVFCLKKKKNEVAGHYAGFDFSSHHRNCISLIGSK